MPLRLDIRDLDFAAAFSAFLEVKREAEAEVDATVAEILAEVRKRGDAALADYTRRFDRFEVAPEDFRVGERELDAALAACAPQTLTALEHAKARLEAHHARQLPEDLDYVDGEGLRLGHRWTPVAAAGLYVPGGTAAYPSSVLMNAVPAKVAGVKRIAMTVPAPDGKLNPLVLAAARICGISEIYRLGGAQAIAALAYGSESIVPVDKITGPGNAYVAAAKR
ncbi:MAG: histidinol dehydrogenase, partial [Rhodovibrionaceae bacterium]